jgi:NAD+ synthetase
MKIALAQINPTVGDIEGNAARIVQDIHRAREAGVHLVVFPEMAIFGYPPKDLLLRADLVRRNVAAVEQIAAACADLTAVVGFAEPDNTGSGTGLLNAAAVCRGGTVQATYAKMLLPTYDVFDERRYFNAGAEVRIQPVPVDGQTIPMGLSVCEDIWSDRQFDGRRVYGFDPVELVATAGARVLVNLAASPYRAGVQQVRETLFSGQMRAYGLPLVYVNQVGGNDDLLFDGASLVLDRAGEVVARARAFEEDLLFADLDAPSAARVETYPDRVEGIHRAVVLGIRDYIRKCRFHQVVVGLSGGIDSAVTAALGVEALGPGCVHGVAMPARFSSTHSVEDAQALAENLGIEFSIIPIEGAHRAVEDAVAAQFARAGPDAPTIAEENIQARIRGNILMSLCNKFGALLLTTGNKSELAVGYCTLYGDMCGGLAVLSDVPKTTVYELAHDINREAGRAVIPERTITKAPSAELRENQTDQDTLPPYNVLDAILEHYVEKEGCVEDIVRAGFDRATVEHVVRLVDQSEYKRKQAAVGLRVTSRAFGTGRRMPIAARFR